MNSLDVKVNLNTGTVTLTITKRTYGRLKERRQFTFSEQEFRRALQSANITLPWRDR